MTFAWSGLISARRTTVVSVDSRQVANNHSCSPLQQSAHLSMEFANTIGRQRPLCDVFSNLLQRLKFFEQNHWKHCVFVHFTISPAVQKEARGSQGGPGHMAPLDHRPNKTCGNKKETCFAPKLSFKRRGECEFTTVSTEPCVWKQRLLCRGASCTDRNTAVIFFLTTTTQENLFSKTSAQNSGFDLNLLILATKLGVASRNKRKSNVISNQAQILKANSRGLDSEALSRQHTLKNCIILQCPGEWL